MKKQISSIRSILDEMELSGETPTSAATSLEIEVAQVVQDIVDLLQPILTPYQAAFYWYLMRRSWLGSGSDLIRVSTRGLGTGVVKSARSETVSQGQVKDLLASLEVVGAIRKEAEPNREGTLYRVMIPEQIEACQQRKFELGFIEPIIAPDESEADYYNVKENRRKIFDRDGYVCYYCKKLLTRLTVTLDHIVAVVEGGDNSEANLVTSCHNCNSRKNRRLISDFLPESNG
jgi:HNH endonuclease